MEATMNMTSAGLHVLADLFRCTATIIVALYIIFRPGWPSSGADDFGGAVVTVLITIGVLGGLYECLKDSLCGKKGSGASEKGEEVEDSSDSEFDG